MLVTRRPSVSLSLLALTLTFAGACHKKKPVTVETPTPAPAATTDDAAERARREAAEREAADRARREAEAREAAARATAAARAALQAPVYFAYDRSDLEAEARQALDAKLPVLQANTGVHIRIAGHTDERGSDEYNLALGSRRAAAAKRYLTQHGIDEGRIEIVSFGVERPSCTESAESCWSRNRRDEFEITVGTIAAAQP